MTSPNSVKMYKSVLENMREGVRFITDMGQVFFWNRGAEMLTGFGKDEMEGALCEALHIVREEGEESVCSVLCPLNAEPENTEIEGLKVFIRHRDGFLVPALMNVTPLLDDEGNKVGVAEMFHDMSLNDEALERLEQLAELSLVDPLLGIGNRNHADQTLKAKAEEYRRYGTKYGLALINVDDFRQVNETYGNQSGDDMLNIISKSLASTLRPFDTFCRWAGDEFVVIAANMRNDQNMMNMANRLRLLVEESSMEVNGSKVSATVSIGAVIVRPRESEEDLLKRAEGFLYQSKSLGKNIVTMGRDFIENP